MRLVYLPREGSMFAKHHLLSRQGRLCEGSRSDAALDAACAAVCFGCSGRIGGVTRAIGAWRICTYSSRFADRNAALLRCQR
jgi:hypothetical protein